MGRTRRKRGGACAKDVSVTNNAIDKVKGEANNIGMVSLGEFKGKTLEETVEVKSGFLAGKINKYKDKIKCFVNHPDAKEIIDALKDLIKTEGKGAISIEEYVDMKEDDLPYLMITKYLMDNPTQGGRRRRTKKRKSRRRRKKRTKKKRRRKSRRRRRR